MPHTQRRSCSLLAAMTMHHDMLAYATVPFLSDQAVVGIAIVTLLYVSFAIKLSIQHVRAERMDTI